jgi:hypothetical protein
MFSWLPFCASLTDDDISSLALRTVHKFDTKALSMRTLLI